MNDAENDKRAVQKRFVEQIGYGRNAQRHQCERDKSSEIPPRERTAYAAKEKKDADDDLPHIDAHVPFPIANGGALPLGKEVGAQNLIDRGHHAPKAIHKVIEHHEEDAKSPQKVDLPESFSLPMGISAHHCFEAGNARALRVDACDIHLFQFTIFCRILSTARTVKSVYCPSSGKISHKIPSRAESESAAKSRFRHSAQPRIPRI